MRNLDLARYAWADQDRELSWTLAVITGRDRESVIRAYGGDPDAEPSTMPFDDAWLDDELAASLVQVRVEGKYVLTIENNGWIGKSSGVPQRASENGGHIICIHWDANQNSSIAEARNGELLASFEPMPSRRFELPEWMADIEFTSANKRSTMLAMVEQQIGLAFDRAWLDEPTPTYRIPYPGATGVATPASTPVA